MFQFKIQYYIVWAAVGMGIGLQQYLPCVQQKWGGVMDTCPRRLGQVCRVSLNSRCTCFKTSLPQCPASPGDCTCSLGAFLTYFPDYLSYIGLLFNKNYKQFSMGKKIATCSFAEKALQFTKLYTFCFKEQQRTCLLRNEGSRRPPWRCWAPGALVGSRAGGWDLARSPLLPSEAAGASVAMERGLGCSPFSPSTERLQLPGVGALLALLEL